MSSLSLYILLKLDAIIQLFCWIMYPSAILFFSSLVFCIILFIAPYYYSFEDEFFQRPSEDAIKDYRAKCKGLLIPVRRLLFITLSVWIISISAVSLIPTTKEMGVLYVVPKMANSEIVQKIPKKILLLADEWLEELRPKNNLEDNLLKQEEIK